MFEGGEPPADFASDTGEIVKALRVFRDAAAQYGRHKVYNDFLQDLKDGVETASRLRPLWDRIRAGTYFQEYIRNKNVQLRLL